MSKEKSAELLAQMRKDRLHKHLNEVGDLGERWIGELTAPNPFHWRESDESWITRPEVKAAQVIRLSESSEETRWEMWGCREVYVPSLERDAASNHMLRKHLRKRALWRYHNEWEQRLNQIPVFGRPLCERAAKMQEERKARRDLTKDYIPVALQTALEFALGRNPAKSYYQGAGFRRGVWYGEILIEQSASSKQVDEVAEEHWQIVSELGHSDDMKGLALEWQQIMILQERMRGLAWKAIKSGDVLFACQFCKRLWQE